MKASTITKVFDRERSGWGSLSPWRLMILFILCAASGYGATNYYVWRDNPSPVSPFTNWAMAAVSIQDAVDLTLNGDTVYVTNGVYDTGGKVTPGYALTNRVYMAKPFDGAITLTSMNGPAVTIIQGAEAPGGGNGIGAVRCVYLEWASGGGSLIGFTLTNGHTMKWNEGDYTRDNSGGGVLFRHGWVVSNCLISGNSAGTEGGGAFIYNGYGGGTLNNCILSGNTAGTGGGASGNTDSDPYSMGNGRLNNCILSGNRAIICGGILLPVGVNLNNCLLFGNFGGSYGGARFFGDGTALSNCTVVGNTATNGEAGGVGFDAGVLGVLNNCIIWGNSASTGEQNIQTNSVGVIRYTCSSPQPDGVGNIGSDPLFVNTNAGNYRLSANSPCVNRGTNANWMLNAVDLDGIQRIRYGTVDMGAYERIYEGTIFTIH